MNILFVYFRQTIQAENLYIRSLYEEIQRQNPGDTECDIETFWHSSKRYDIVHIQFPEVIFKWRHPSEEGLNALRKRLVQLKRQGTKIVYTRHNAIPHYCADSNKLELYRIVETLCDAIIHLGKFSLQDFNRAYPDNRVTHFVIPHHIYDLCGYTFPSQEESIRQLGLPTGKRIILTFGSYRNEEEQRLVTQAFEQLPIPDKFLLAPGFYNNCFVTRKTPLRNWWRYRTQKRTFQLPEEQARQQHGSISNSCLPYYFSAADIVLIQRKATLNSGNVPMAFFFHKSVAGPQFGNTGEWLRETGNPTFDLTDPSSVVEAVERAFRLQAQGQGERNAAFAREHLNTHTVARATLAAYQELLNP